MSLNHPHLKASDVYEWVRVIPNETNDGFQLVIGHSYAHRARADDCDACFPSCLVCLTVLPWLNRRNIGPVGAWCSPSSPLNLMEKLRRNDNKKKLDERGNPA